MQIKSNVEINGTKYYSVEQIKEMLSYVAFSDYQLSQNWLNDADQTSTAIASDYLSSSYHISRLAKRVCNYFC